ncbi:tyrosine-type recombinase/integrase [Vibrio lentus]
MQTTPIDGLQRAELKKLVMETTLKQTTVKARTRMLRRVIQYHLAEDNLDASSLMTGGEKEGKKPLPQNAHELILKATKGRKDWQYALTRLLPLTGMRISEMLALDPGDISDGAILIKQGKTANAVRQIPISKEMQAILDNITPVDGKLIPHSSDRSV